MRKIFVSLAIATTMVAWAPVTSKAEVVLRAVSFRPLNDTEVSMPMFRRLIEKVNTAGKGIVRIEHIGGPEVIPPPDQAAAVGRGIADIAVTHTMHNAIVPEVGTLLVSRLTPQQERKSGYFDMLDEAHKKMNLKLIGRAATDVGFHIFSKTKIDSLSDFKGLKLRSHAGTHEFFRQLGAIPVNMAISEIFAGLERGVVSGAPYPIAGSGALGLHEVTKYLLMDPLWPSHSTIVLINREKWNALPEEARTIIKNAQLEHEKEMAALIAELKRKDVEQLKANGMKIVELPPSEKAKWLRISEEARWAPILRQLPPERIAQIKKMLGTK